MKQLRGEGIDTDRSQVAECPDGKLVYTDCSRLVTEAGGLETAC